MGGDLGTGLDELASRHEIIGNVQGSGLFWGLDLVADRDTREPIAYADAKRIATAMRHAGVLVGVTGRYTNVLKIRPPLVFRPEHADILLTALDDVLGTYRAARRRRRESPRRRVVNVTKGAWHLLSRARRNRCRCSARGDATMVA